MTSQAGKRYVNTTTWSLSKTTRIEIIIALVVLYANGAMCFHVFV